MLFGVEVFLVLFLEVQLGKELHTDWVGLRMVHLDPRLRIVVRFWQRQTQVQEEVFQRIQTIDAEAEGRAKKNQERIKRLKAKVEDLRECMSQRLIQVSERINARQGMPSQK